jgi:hypothetical protein
MREESSNFRELRNLVEMIESLVSKGTLAGHELFMFTDNSTAESAFFKGTSSSEKLFDLVLRLRKIEMEGKLFIHLIHVSGTRMISSGVDGLSRGDHNAGVMAGESMLSFVPLSQNAAERSAAVLPWVRSWGSSKDKSKEVKVLSPTESGATLTRVVKLMFGCRRLQRQGRRSIGWGNQFTKDPIRFISCLSRVY